MGEDRPWSEIELRRLAKQQRSPEFRAWLDREPEDLAQLITLVPALAELDDPWTVEGLARIEDAALAKFPNPGEKATDDEMAYLSLCARGIGHTYLRAMGVGKWVWVQILQGNPIGAALEFPGIGVYIDPEGSIRHVIFDREPHSLARQLDTLLTWNTPAYQ
ncbi:hypothetical protein [Nocardia rosealba]|uniref:hypothetical protein n=1 Tax=Nocardia rosealba TaxID=2878563 RepID=UPI001CD9CDF7|nr:hypothetical protein [Nocardia rosealba]MCA2207687.1 hypothetical protein [Nocardia rosealba]